MSTLQKLIFIGMLLVFAPASAPAAVYNGINAAANADARRLLRMMDADKNGRVSKDEFLQFISRTFDRLDLNKSDQLEGNESSTTAFPFGMRTNAAAKVDVRQLVRMMDTDKNGTVSKDEFLQFMSRTFDRALTWLPVARAISTAVDSSAAWSRATTAILVPSLASW
jgi:Ca2+-binding EF-hand superfamily protein